MIRKPKGITARLRARKRRRLDTKESAAMQEVRDRDERPRFPLASVSRWPAYDECQPLEVSHSEHRGMGGDPTGKRTQRQTMLLLSRKRHTGHKFSVDQGGLKWTPNDPERGSDGPIQWWLNCDYLPAEYVTAKALPKGHWVQLAIEYEPHHWWPLTSEQKELFALID